jgi:hypothetical protein
MTDNPLIRSLGGGVASNADDGSPTKIFTVPAKNAGANISIRITHTDKAGAPIDVTLYKQIISKEKGTLIPVNGVDITYLPGYFSIASGINMEQNESLLLDVSANGIIEYDIEGELFKPVNLTQG